MTRAPDRIVRFLRPGASVGLPKGIFAAVRREPPPIRVAPVLLETASLTMEGVYQRLGSRVTGLTTEEAEARLGEYGPNMVAADGRKGIGLLLWHAVINPLVLLLAVLATISFSTGDVRAARWRMGHDRIEAMRGMCRFGVVALIVVSSACARSGSQSALAVTNLEFLTRPGCANTATMSGRLDEALGRLGLATEYRVIDLATLPESDARRGYPTPTLLYGGHDLFGMVEPQPPYPEPT